ncbi:hypothetical protein Tco_0783665 [Tanacetum coccineum]
MYVCPAVGSNCADTMADMNMSTNDVPAEQAPAIAPPTRMDDQILPSNKWVPSVRLTAAFTASSTILAIYIQQFWDTMCFNSSTGLYSCQLDEQWFNLHKHILQDALDITPYNDNNPFVAPPSSDTVIEYVNTLGYPCKTARYDRPRHPMLQILWGITHRSNIDYAERIGKSLFNPYKLSSLTGRTLLQLLMERRRPLIYLFQTYVGKDGREIFGMPIPDALLTDAIKSAPYYNSYLEHVTEYQRYLNEKHVKADDKSPELASSQPPKPTPTPTESSKKDQGKKRKLVMESTNAPSPAK